MKGRRVQSSNPKKKQNKRTGRGDKSRRKRKTKIKLDAKKRIRFKKLREEKQKITAEKRNMIGGKGSQRKRKFNFKKQIRNEKMSKRGKPFHGKRNPKKTLKKGKIKTKNKNTRCSMQSRSGVTANCIRSAVFYMNMMATVVANFNKQSKRMSKQNKTGESKSGKKGLFKPLVGRLIQAGGGNKSKMMCGGQKESPGSMQLTNLTSKFEACETSINQSCNTENFPQPNKTRLDICSEKVKSFSSSVKSCAKKQNTEACNCWLDSSLNSTSAIVKTCSFKTEADAIAKQLKVCKKAFSICRKYEDDTIKSLSACSKSLDKLKEKAKQLLDNIAALEKAKEKISSLTATSSKQSSSCAIVLQLVSILILTVKQYPASQKIVTLGNQISVSGEFSCSDEEKNMLKEKENNLIISVELVIQHYETIVEDIASKFLLL